MSNSSTLVKAARKSRGLTQQQLAERVRVDQGTISRSESGRDAGFNSVDRLLAGAGYRLYAAPTRRDDVATVSSRIRELLRKQDKDRALRALIQFNDDLVAENGLIRGVLAVAEPESTRNPVWDAAIAGIVAWRLREQGLPVPGWVNEPTRFLTRPQTLSIDPADPLPSPKQVPPELARRGVLVWQDTFESV